MMVGGSLIVPVGFHFKMDCSFYSENLRSRKFCLRAA